MIPELEFFKPKDIKETLVLLEKYRGNARVIAGGTDIIPGFQQGLKRFKNIKVLIDIHDLKELGTITREGDQVTIGAGVTFSCLNKNPLINKLFPILSQAAGSIGSVQIRNRAVLAGNFVNNAPCADSVPALLVYNATVCIESLQSKRQLPLEEFLIKPYQTQLEPDELVTQVTIPVLNENYRGDFYKLGRRRGVAISRISVALLLDIQDSIIQDFRVASGAITPIGKRFKSLEESARGKKAGSELFHKLAEELGQQMVDITGVRWSTEYKLPVIQKVFYRLLEDLWQPGGSF